MRLTHRPVAALDHQPATADTPDSPTGLYGLLAGCRPGGVISEDWRRPVKADAGEQLTLWGVDQQLHAPLLEAAGAQNARALYSGDCGAVYVPGSWDVEDCRVYVRGQLTVAVSCALLCGVELGVESRPWLKGSLVLLAAPAPWCLEGVLAEGARRRRKLNELTQEDCDGHDD